MQKHKKIWLKAVSVFLLIVLYSCHYDDALPLESNGNKNSKYSAKWVKSRELSRNMRLMEIMGRFEGNRENRLGARTVYLEQYDFSIETEEALFIGNDSIHSYTFRMYRDEDNGYVENLVLKKFPDEAYKAFIFRYDLTEEEKEAIAAGQSITDYWNKLEVAYLPDVSDDILQQRLAGPIEPIIFISSDCYGTLIDYQYQEWTDSNGIGMWESLELYEIDCDWSIQVVGGSTTTTGPGDTGGSTGGGSTFDNGGGGAGPGTGGSTLGGFPSGSGTTTSGTGTSQTTVSTLNNTTNPFLTAPLVADKDSRIAQRLKKLTDNRSNGTKTPVKAFIDNLRSRLATEIYQEDGRMFDKHQNELLPSSRGWRSVSWFGYPATHYIQIHFHPNQSTNPANLQLVQSNPIYSDADTYGLLENLHTTNNTDATQILVSRAGTFAIVVTNKQQALQAYNQLTGSTGEWRSFTESYDGYVTKPYSENPQNLHGIVNGYVKFLTETKIAGQPLGLTIFKAQYNAQGDIVQWNKL